MQTVTKVRPVMLEASQWVLGMQNLIANLLLARTGKQETKLTHQKLRKHRNRRRVKTGWNVSSESGKAVWR